MKEKHSTLQTVQHQNQVMITKRGRSVKDCHKSGEIWENYDPRGNEERAVKNESLSVKSGG